MIIRVTLAVMICALLILPACRTARVVPAASPVPGVTSRQARVVILDLKADGVSATTARAVSAILRTDMAAMEELTVVERNQIDEVFREYELQQTGCTDSECAVKMGKLLSANKLITGEVLVLGSQVVICVRMVDVETGSINISLKKEAPSEDSIYGAVTMLSGMMRDKIRERVPGAAGRPKNAISYRTGDVKKVGGIEFVYIQGGKFIMGANTYADDDKKNYMPAHQVEVSSFWMGKYEVTQGQYKALMGSYPVKYRGDNYPAVSIQWLEAREFCRRFREKHGTAVRLPYEAEWEYACRAGTVSMYYWGELHMDARKYCWYDSNSESFFGQSYEHPVGTKLPNPWGLYDMLGNAEEWCMDWYEKDSYTAKARINPKGPGRGFNKVLRGGAFWETVKPVYYRGDSHFETRWHGYGFRLVVSEE